MQNTYVHTFTVITGKKISTEEKNKTTKKQTFFLKVQAANDAICRYLSYITLYIPAQTKTKEGEKQRLSPLSFKHWISKKF